MPASPGSPTATSEEVMHSVGASGWGALPAPLPSSQAPQTPPATGAFGWGCRGPWRDASHAHRAGGKTISPVLLPHLRGDRRPLHGGDASTQQAGPDMAILTYCPQSSKRQPGSLADLRLRGAERNGRGGACMPVRGQASEGRVAAAPTPSSNPFFALISDRLLFTGIEN